MRKSRDRIKLWDDVSWEEKLNSNKYIQVNYGMRNVNLNLKLITIVVASMTFSEPSKDELREGTKTRMSGEQRDIRKKIRRLKTHHDNANSVGKN